MPAKHNGPGPQPSSGLHEQILIAVGAQLVPKSRAEHGEMSDPIAMAEGRKRFVIDGGPGASSTASRSHVAPRAERRDHEDRGQTTSRPRNGGHSWSPAVTNGQSDRDADLGNPGNTGFS